MHASTSAPQEKRETAMRDAALVGPGGGLAVDEDDGDGDGGEGAFVGCNVAGIVSFTDTVKFWMSDACVTTTQPEVAADTSTDAASGFEFSTIVKEP